MKKDDVSYITVGKIGSTYGIQGWLKINTYTEFGASILTYQPWFIQTNDDDWKAIQIEDAAVHGKGVVVKFNGIDTPEAARLYTGKLIAITRDTLPVLQPDEYYWSDLKGLTVINQDGMVLGKIIYLIETGSNDVMVVKGEKEHAIPYLPGSVVKNIDLKKQEMIVDWELI